MLKKHKYNQDPHYNEYKVLSIAENVFFPVGEGGLSKADVARRAIPAIREICKKHIGKNVVIVTHGGVLNFLDVLLGNYVPGHKNHVVHGDLLRVDGDGVKLVVVSN